MASVKTSLTPTRRTLLGTAALAAPASLLPAIAAAAEENRSPITTGFQDPDPHPAWYAERQALLDWCDHSPEVGRWDLAEVPQWGRLNEIENRIATTPAVTLAGATVQLRLARYFVAEFDLLGETGKDALANAIAALERLAGEAARA